MMRIVDFHTHILPGIDDGSKNVDESIEMLLQESKAGIKHVVLTPHFYPTHNNPKTFLERREKAYKILKEEVKKYSDLPSLYLGAEVYFFDGIAQWEGLKDFTIANSKYVMIEMPMPPWSSRMYKELENIVDNLGLIPIIAHIDRYISPFKTYDIPNKLNELPLVIQANSSFFIKPLTQRYALKLLNKGMIHVLGSDCHNMTSRPPTLDLAIEKITSKAGESIIKNIEEFGMEILK